jgi:hypothetical protein
MNWLSKILAALPMIPGIVMGIETIHGQAKSGVDKKTLALESLGLSSAVAGAVSPGHANEISAATDMASEIIDSVVKGFNAFGWHGHSVTPVVVTPAPPTKKETGN